MGEQDFSLSPLPRYKSGGRGAETWVSCLSSPGAGSGRGDSGTEHHCPAALSPGPGREELPAQGKTLSQAGANTCVLLAVAAVSSYFKSLTLPLR